MSKSRYIFAMSKGNNKFPKRQTKAYFKHFIRKVFQEGNLPNQTTNKQCG